MGTSVDLEFCWRVTKYDPRWRTSTGAYDRDEWIGAAQIGSVFADGVLTTEEYLRVEGLYVAAATGLWAACRAPRLQIQALEGTQSFGLPPSSDDLDDVGFGDWRPINGEYLPERMVGAMVRWCLRSLGWCMLEGAGFYLHFGYDFYMFVGTAVSSEPAIQRVIRSGLFVEPCDSPFRRGPPKALSISIARIDANVVERTVELGPLDSVALAELWPPVTSLVGMSIREIDQAMVGRLAGHVDFEFDFERFTYHLNVDE